MKGYGEYKKISLPGLNKIPSHWKVQRGKQLFMQINARSASGTEELLSVSAAHGVVKRKNANVTMFQATSYAGYKLCWPDDLVINSLWAWQQGLGFSKYHGIISTAYSVFRLRNTEASNPRYYNYFVRGSDYIWELYVRSKGIWKSRYQLSDDDFLRSPIISPPREEQDQIVRYLDAKVNKINKLIKIKQQQIALLKEKKQAIINQAVTKGLDPNAPMKDSGIAWIGQIPEGWEVKKLKRFMSKIIQGWSPQCENRPAENNELCVLKVGCVNDIHFDETQNKILPEGLRPPRDLFLKKNMILVSRANTKNLVGLASFVEKDYKNILLCDKIYSFFVDTNKLNTKFAVYAIRSSPSRGHIENSTSGASSSMQNITQDTIRELNIALPNIEEQNLIANSCDEKITNLSALRDIYAQQIATLTEYRTRLISNVVTGKVDVRGLAVSDTCEEEQKNVIDGHPWLAQEDEDEYSVDDPEEQME